MFQCNKLIVCGLLIGLALHASADVEIKPEDENQTGAKQDLALLEQVIAERPYTARGVTKSLEVFKRRLERVKQASRPILRGEPSASEAATGNVAENATKQSVANRDGHISTKSWMIWALFGMIIAAIPIWRWKSKSTP